MHTAKNKPEQVKEMIFPTLLKIAVGRGRSLLPPEKKKNLLTSLRQSYQAQVNRRLCLSSGFIFRWSICYEITLETPFTKKYR